MSLNKIFYVLPAFLFLQGCTEAYLLLTNTYEETLIVESTITNEFKNQEVKLTKTAKFEDTNYIPESEAQVFLTDDISNQYNFKDDGDRYISEIEFQAVPERKYQLHFINKDGRSFESSPEILTAVSPIEILKAAVETEDRLKNKKIVTAL